MDFLRYAVIVIILILIFFLGWILGKRSEKRKYDGCLFVESKDDRDIFRWVFEEDLQEIQERKDIFIQVINKTKGE